MESLRILVAGDTDVPPPYGGLARRVLNNCHEWEQRHAVTLLLNAGCAPRPVAPRVPRATKKT